MPLPKSLSPEVPRISEARPAALDSAEDADPGGPLIETVTIADIFVEQGLYGPAMQIYKKIAQRRPEDIEIKERIQRLEVQMAAPSVDPSSSKNSADSLPEQ